MKKIILVLACVFLASFQLCAQSIDPLEKETLRGLPGVYVFLNISDENSSLERDGLTTSQVQTDIEIRLRKAGIKVFNLEEVKKLSTKPTLFISILASKNEALTKYLGESIYSFSIQVDLKQTANLINSPVNIFLVTTWSNSAVGMTSKRNLRAMRDGVADYVDKFINDYLTVNSK